VSPSDTTTGKALVCVLCGRPWLPLAKNLCDFCGGFRTWGLAPGAEPSTWQLTENGYIPRLPS